MVHVLEGFVPIRSSTQCVPPWGVGKSDQTVVRACLKAASLSGSGSIWHRIRCMYGPDLTKYLVWYEAGDMLHLQWAEDVVLRIEGRDARMHGEETRLVDRDAMAELRVCT